MLDGKVYVIPRIRKIGRHDKKCACTRKLACSSEDGDLRVWLTSKFRREESQDRRCCRGEMLPIKKPTEKYKSLGLQFVFLVFVFVGVFWKVWTWLFGCTTEPALHVSSLLRNARPTPKSSKLPPLRGYLPQLIRRLTIQKLDQKFDITMQCTGSA